MVVAGPEAREMAANFQAFWDARRSVPAERLNDVGRRLLESGGNGVGVRDVAMDRQRRVGCGGRLDGPATAA